MAINRAQLFAIINNAINDVYLYLWSYFFFFFLHFFFKFTSLGYLLSTKIYTFQSFWSTLSNQKFRSIHIHARSKSICLPTPSRKLNTISVFCFCQYLGDKKWKPPFFPLISSKAEYLFMSLLTFLLCELLTHIF